MIHGKTCEKQFKSIFSVEKKKMPFTCPQKHLSRKKKTAYLLFAYSYVNSRP